MKKLIIALCGIILLGSISVYAAVEIGSVDKILTAKIVKSFQKTYSNLEARGVNCDNYVSVIERFQKRIKLTLQKNKVERTKNIKAYSKTQITNYVEGILACDQEEDVTIEDVEECPYECETGCYAGACVRSTQTKEDTPIRKIVDYPQCDETLKDTIFVCDKDEWIGASIKITERSDNFVTIHTEGQFIESNSDRLVDDAVFEAEQVIGGVYQIKIENIGVDGDNSKVRLSLKKKILQIKNNCTDSDGGANYFTKGIVNGEDGYRKDACVSEDTLQEGSCIQGLGTHTYTCPNGCKNGVCLKK